MILFLALAMMAADPAPAELRPTFDALRQQTDAIHGRRIKQAIAASPVLSRRLAALAKNGIFKGIVVKPPEAALDRIGLKLRAWRTDGTIFITSDLLDKLATPDRRFRTLDYSRNNPDDLVMVLAFLAAKLDSQVALEKTQSDMKLAFQAEVAKGPSDTPVDATSVMKSFMESSINDDARAYIIGWNAVFDAAENSAGQKLDLKDFADLVMKMRYNKPLLASMQAPVDAIVTPPTLRFGLDAHSIHAIATVLGNQQMPEFK